MDGENTQFGASCSLASQSLCSQRRLRRARERSADIFPVFASERRLVRALCGRLVRRRGRGLVLAKIMATLSPPPQ